MVISKCQENFLKFSFLCVCVGVLQSPTAQRCGWWCLWCACRSWLSPSSSSSSSAPWDTTAACRALRVSDGVAPASVRQSTHHHCSFHSIITNLSLCQLCKRGGADLRRVFVQIIIIKRSAFFFDCTWFKTITSHPQCGLFNNNETNADCVVVVDVDVFTVLVTSPLLQLFTVCVSAQTHLFLIRTCCSLCFNKLTQVEVNSFYVTGRCLRTLVIFLSSVSNRFKHV